MFIHKRLSVNYEIDMYKDPETDQFVGIARDLWYSGYGKTIDEAIKNTNTSVQMALAWYIENNKLEELENILREAGYEPKVVDNISVWNNAKYIGSFESAAVA